MLQGSALQLVPDMLLSSHLPGCRVRNQAVLSPLTVVWSSSEKETVDSVWRLWGSAVDQMVYVHHQWRSKLLQLGPVAATDSGSENVNVHPSAHAESCTRHWYCCKM